MKINDMCKKSHKIAKEKGFWNDGRSVPESLMLIVTELGEACEADRLGDREGLHEELADAYIRLGDLCGSLHLDIEKEIEEKWKLIRKDLNYMERNINGIFSMSRISRDDYYFNIAKEVAKRSTCLRRKFGAIIVRDDVILSTGYNGPARGEPHCKICLRDQLKKKHKDEYEICPAVHAEENAIINAARNGMSIKDGKLYLIGLEKNGTDIRTSPCYRCSRALKNAGIMDINI